MILSHITGDKPTIEIDRNSTPSEEYCYQSLYKENSSEDRESQHQSQEGNVFDRSERRIDQGMQQLCTLDDGN